MQSIKVHSVSGDVRPVNAISVWDASSTGKRPVDSIPVWNETNAGDKPLNAIQVKLVDDEPGAIKVWFKGGEGPVDPYNPLGLPPYTIRLKYKEGTTPTFSKGTGTLVDAENNIWDLTYENSDWTSVLYGHTSLLEVLGANTTGVTKMDWMFNGCTSLTNVALFDTSSVKVTSYMFNGCSNVESGALALYKQASTQANPPTYHTDTFKGCGSNTQTGAAELAQIPTDWGGTKSD